jgi:Tol biopolymer transport system component
MPMSKTIHHKQAQEYLQALADDLDIEANHGAVEAHLETCSQCRTYASELNALEANLSRVLHAHWDENHPPDPVQPVDILSASERKARRKYVFSLTGAVVLVILMVISLVGILNWYLPQFSGQPSISSTAMNTPIGGVIAPTSPGPTPEEGTQNLQRSIPAGTIVFQSRRDGNDEIYLLPSGGNEVTNLTDHRANDTHPALSPDGSWLAFLSDRNGKVEVFIMDISTRSTRQLTDNPGITWFPPLAWSPDGSRIAVAGYPEGEDERTAQVYLVNLDGGGAKLLFAFPNARYPKWSPDGGKLAFYGFNEPLHSIYIYDLTSDEIKNLSSEENDSGIDVGIGGSFSWSPDGSQLVFLATGPRNDFGSTRARAQFIIVDLNNKDRELIFDKVMPNGIRFASWSPDGKTVMFVQDEKNDGCWTIHLLNLEHPDELDVRGVCYTMRTNEAEWTPDGRWLVFSGWKEGTYQAPSIYALEVHSAMENPDEPTFVPLTEEDGIDTNPQIRVPVAPLTKEAIASCPVSSPNIQESPHEHFISSTYGYENDDRTLFTDLWPGGKVHFAPEQVSPDGSLWIKWGWWRELDEDLVIEGRRLDAPAPPLMAQVPCCYGVPGFQVSEIIFPSEGCWEVTGKTGNATLTFVTLAVKIPFEPSSLANRPEGLIQIDTDLSDLPRSVSRVYGYPSGENGTLILQTGLGQLESLATVPESAKRIVTFEGNEAACIQGTWDVQSQWQAEADAGILEWTAGIFSYRISHSGLGLGCEDLLQLCKVDSEKPDCTID